MGGIVIIYLPMLLSIIIIFSFVFLFFSFGRARVEINVIWKEKLDLQKDKGHTSLLHKER